MTSQFASSSKSEINLKIFVVGASDCGIAFAEYLTSQSKSTFGKFTNVTLISSNGLPYKNKNSCLELKLIPFKGRYCYNYWQVNEERVTFNIIIGTVIDINRKEKYISVKKLGNLKYDYLILTCGVQFDKLKFWKKIEEEKEAETPINSLTINDEIEATVCVEILQKSTDNFKIQNSIVFYGNCIECFCTINAFLEMGVKGSWITLIECDKVFFHDNEIDETIIKEIINRGVKIISEWKIFDWELTTNSSGNWIIKSLEIESNLEIQKIPCDILMNFSRKNIQLTNIMAFSRAGLVFNELLVIDAKNQTNDPFIFAAGTVTKYSGKYMVNSIKMKYFNSLEIGEKFAINFIKIMESRLEEKEESTKFNTLPIFQIPNYISCILPGGYYYLHIEKPGETNMIDNSEKNYGSIYKTGSCTSDIGYFKIRLNSSGFVKSVTCCSKKNFEIQRLKFLYEKHESLLNHLKNQFQNSLILDFYSYFQEPWATAILTDNFQSFQIKNREILLSKFSDRSQSLTEEIFNLIKDQDVRKLIY
ncbi:cilia- and flagella-associated protein 61 isoform X2 [Leptopilina boulardi]|uniref:cilia- and flagella-associated protein 61 isoform X2 n=1 Tax=Leptopilina boulardi TaxID=63433 RepID=UPI0021F63FA3|nr:cilia- and flagella-associated protein 61 isoform X2 [Leptopilina boulardi]